LYTSVCHKIPGFALTPLTTRVVDVLPNPHWGILGNVVIILVFGIVIWGSCVVVIKTGVFGIFDCGQQTIGVLCMNPHVDDRRKVRTRGLSLLVSNKFNNSVQLYMFMQIPYISSGVSHGTPSATKVHLL
jgi:hypothetical protein